MLRLLWGQGWPQSPVPTLILPQAPCLPPPNPRNLRSSSAPCSSTSPAPLTSMASSYLPSIPAPSPQQWFSNINMLPGHQEGSLIGGWGPISEFLIWEPWDGGSRNICIQMISADAPGWESSTLEWTQRVWRACHTLFCECHVSMNFFLSLGDIHSCLLSLSSPAYNPSHPPARSR